MPRPTLHFVSANESAQSGDAPYDALVADAGEGPGEVLLDQGISGLPAPGFYKYGWDGVVS